MSWNTVVASIPATVLKMLSVIHFGAGSSEILHLRIFSKVKNTRRGSLMLSSP